MRHFLLIMVMGQPVLAADKKPLTKEESEKVIEAAIRRVAKKPTGELTKADLEKLTFLSLGGKKLTNVKGLEKLSQLTRLSLGFNQLTDVKGLEKLTQLRELHLFNNQLTDVKGLEKLTQLEGLLISDNFDLTKAQIDQLQKALPNFRISHNAKLTKEESAKVIEAVIRKELKKPTGELTKADLEKVTVLSLAFKNMTSVKGLEKLTKLTYLNLDRNQLTEVPKELEKLAQLTVLGFESNQLTDLKGLEKLTQLRELNLYGNQLADVKGLEKLMELTFLFLNANKLTDLKGLEKLTQLEVLFLEYNPDLTKAQIAQLRKVLPKCRIESNPTK